MRSAVGAGGLALLLVVTGGQTRQPLRKTDLIRHLSGSALGKPEIADLIRRNCLSFTPTERDRADLRALGADAGIMARIDECVRRDTRAPLRIQELPASVTAEAGGEATIVVKVGRGVEVERGARLILRGSSRIPGGPSRDLEAATNGLGVATFRVPAGTAPGTYPLTIASAAGETLAGRTAVSLETTPAGGVRAEVRPARIEIRPGEDRRVPVTILVTDGRGNPLGAQAIDLRAAGGGRRPVLSGLSSAQGEAVIAVPVIQYGGGTTLEVRVRGEVVGTVALVLPAVLSTSRTGFVSGMGQRGRVGTRLPQPLVFEARDTANAPIAGRTVVLLAAGARLEQTNAVTDTAGRVQAYVRLGEKAGPVIVSARVGVIERQVALFAVPGPPARLVVTCGGRAVDERITVPADTLAALWVMVHDALGNPVPLTALRASVGDDDVLRQVRVSADSLQGVIVFRPGRGGGTTNLALQASGVRATFVAVVQRRTAGPRVPVCG
jgi:hypothetical protein